MHLRLRNFKGCKEFHLDTKGVNVSIYGDNGTFKTTIFDAFTWLLFGKDSANRVAFEIKTLGADGQPLHGLQHEVEAVLDVDGRQLTLKKVFQEKWTKKRGSATAEFTGHTTDHYVNGVPVQKSEYDAAIAQLADESIFRLLTDPTFFNEQLHWQERRKILLEVCGDVSDDQVIASDPALADLPVILQGRKLEEHRKVIQARQTAINKELQQIPVRVDEAQRALPNISQIRPDALAADIERCREAIGKLEAERRDVEAGGGLAEKTRALRNVEIEMLAAKRNYELRLDKEKRAAKDALTRLQDEMQVVESRIRQRARDIDVSLQRAERLEQNLAALREQWRQINSEQLTYEPSETCPTCGQALPAEQVEAAREKALADFNLRKAERLEQNQVEGRATKAEAERLRAEAARMLEVNAQDEARLASLRAESAKAQEAVDGLKARADALEQDPEYRAKAEQKAAVEREIEQLKAGVGPVLQELDRQLATMRTALQALETDQARLEQRARGLARIEELKADERRLAAEYERLQREMYLADQFIRAKVRLLTDRINSRFRLARFKLFNVLVNGGVEECCETTYGGVPYGTALNRGARMNVGLDIINTLSEHYGLQAPIFVDNAEAVTKLIPVGSQLIRLVVSEPDKQLRVEYDLEPKEEQA